MLELNTRQAGTRQHPVHSRLCQRPVALPRVLSYARISLPSRDFLIFYQYGRICGLSTVDTQRQSRGSRTILRRIYGLSTFAISFQIFSFYEGFSIDLTNIGWYTGFQWSKWRPKCNLGCPWFCIRKCPILRRGVWINLTNTGGYTGCPRALSFARISLSPRNFHFFTNMDW